METYIELLYSNPSFLEKFYRAEAMVPTEFHIATRAVSEKVSKGKDINVYVDGSLSKNQNEFIFNELLLAQNFQDEFFSKEVRIEADILRYAYKDKIILKGPSVLTKNKIALAI